jgi:hypothetical protein
MEKVTGEPATMWGPSMVGFGHIHYKYETGREGDTFQVGFSPRKAQLTIYGVTNSYGAGDDALERLGKHTTGKGCLYIKRLDDVDLGVLEGMVESAVKVPKSLDH